VVARRRRGKTVCAGDADPASARGPSASPLGVMAIGYNWTCTACGAANAAGTDTCRQCGSNAITSVFEIETGANARRGPPLSAAERFLATLLGTAAFSGAALLWIFNPPDTAWWVGVALFAATFILLGAVKLLRGRK
jgi:hypothetical protein